MKKHLSYLMILLIVCSLTVSCGDGLKKRSKALKEAIGDLKESDNGEIPYEGILPDCLEVVVNSDEFTIFVVRDTTGTRVYEELVMDIETGCVEGKFIYGVLMGIIEGKWMRTPVYKYGFMNKDFSFLTQAEFDKVYPFEQGFAIVMNEDGYGVIGLSGDVIIPCEYKNMPEFSDNQIRISTKSDQNYEEHLYFSKDTEEILYSIRQIYNSENSNPEILKISPDGSEKVIIDIKEWETDELIPFLDIDNGFWGYADGFGQVRIMPEYELAHPFSDDIARVLKKGKYGYIDKSGATIIDCEYDNAFDFYNGLARVSLGGLYGYIDGENNRVIDFKFKQAKDFTASCAPVSTNGYTWNYINEYGNIALYGNYAQAGNYVFGYAPVFYVKEGAYIYIDNEGINAFGDINFFRASEINSDGFAIAFKNVVNSGADSSVVKEYYLIMIKDEY